MHRPRFFVGFFLLFSSRDLLSSSLELQDFGQLHVLNEFGRHDFFVRPDVCVEVAFPVGELAEEPLRLSVEQRGRHDIGDGHRGRVHAQSLGRDHQEALVRQVLAERQDGQVLGQLAVELASLWRLSPQILELRLREHHTAKLRHRTHVHDLRRDGREAERLS